MIYYKHDGALAQLGAHNTGSVGVRGSNPLCSIRTINPNPLLFRRGSGLIFSIIIYPQSESKNAVVDILAGAHSGDFFAVGYVRIPLRHSVSAASAEDGKHVKQKTQEIDQRGQERRKVGQRCR